MGACREPGVTVLIAVGTYVGYNLSAVIQFSMAAVMPTYSFWLLLSGEMHFEMIWEPGQMLESANFTAVGTNHWFWFERKEPLPPWDNLVRPVDGRAYHAFATYFFLASFPAAGSHAASTLSCISSHVPCGWSRKCDPKGWALNSSNHDQPMESWSEALIVWSGGISDKSLCKRILNIQILRHLHSNVSYHYICYKWLVVKHTLFPNLALM